MRTLIKKIVPKKVIDIGSYIITSVAFRLLRPKFPHLVLRKGETDSDVFRNIFLLGELRLPVKVNPELIIDAGAYIGLSTLYYARKYPSAKIIAIEPESSNFDLLETNTSPLSNVTRINAGLWDKEAYLKIGDRGTGKWGFEVNEVSESEDFDIRAVTIENILNESNFERIDILKLDVEGSEKQLFSHNYQLWLDKVNIMVVELHDRFQDGCTETLYSAIEKGDWIEYREGEKVILIRKEYYQDHSNQ